MGHQEEEPGSGLLMAGPFTLSHAGIQPVSQGDTWTPLASQAAFVPTLPFSPYRNFGKHVEEASSTGYKEP